MKVLLVDTSFAAVPIYNYLVKSGHEVWTMGNRQGDLLARRAGEHWIRQDYSDVDAVKKYVLDKQIERVVPGCTDVSIKVCATLPISSGVLDRSETNLLLSDKQSFRRLCRDHGIPAPREVQIEDLPCEGRFICKPVDSYSGRGITVFDGADFEAGKAAVEAAKRASPSSRIVIEQYVEGQLHSCTGFVQNGWLIDTTYVLEGSSANPFAVDTSYVRYDVPAGVRGELEAGLARLCAELGLVDGLLHTQFIMDEDSAYAIEISRRCPGDLYPLLITYSTGEPYADRYTSYFVNAPRPKASAQRKFILRHTVTADEVGIFGGLRLNRPVSTVSFFPIQAMGQDMKPMQSTRCGVLFCETDSFDELTELYSKFLERRVYIVD